MAFVCHAPCALLNVKLPNGDPMIKGKHMTSFSNTEEAGSEVDPGGAVLLENELEKRRALMQRARSGRLCAD